MKEMLKEYKPRIVIRFEPRISGATADAICKKLGKKKWIRSEVVGFSEGIWVPWNDKNVLLRLEYAHRFFIHLRV